MLSWNEQVQLRPSDDADLFPFLRKTVQEWQFLTNLSHVGQLEPSDSCLKGAAIARNIAMDMWNQWMARQLGHEWFRVTRRTVLNEDFTDSERGILLTAGERMLTTRHCEGVMAVAGTREKTIMLPDGAEHTLYNTEVMALQCVSIPPQTRMLMLPLHEVVSVDVLNE